MSNPWRTANAGWPLWSTRAEISEPRVAVALRVTMLITPVTAFAPHREAPGPRTTSMRSMSSISRSSDSQNTPENSGLYTLRPSIWTSSLFEKRPSAMRTPTAQLPAPIWATDTPGTSRRASGTLRAPLRRISSAVSTVTAAGVSESFCVLRETVATSRRARSSSARSARTASSAQASWTLRARGRTRRTRLLGINADLGKKQTRSQRTNHQARIFNKITQSLLPNSWHLAVFADLHPYRP